MYLQSTSNGVVRAVTSASDLTAASACEFAFLRRVDAKLGRQVSVPDDDDAMLTRAAKLGDAHEERTLRAYLDELGPATPGGRGGVAEILRADVRDEEELRRAATATRDALFGGADVVFQGTFFDTSWDRMGDADHQSRTARGERTAAAGGSSDIAFVGFADFLRRLPDGSIEVQDTKLARRAKVTALLQLAAYAEQLDRWGLRVSPEAVLILGDGTRSRHRLSDIAPVFRERRRRLLRVLGERLAAVGADGSRESAVPVAWGAVGILACGRCEVCQAEVRRTRDPLLIAGIRRAQRDMLIAAGVCTIDQVARLSDGGALAEAVGSVLPSGVIERLSAQAAVQVEAEAGEGTPYRMIDPAALAALPQPSPGDLFFDFEGDPLYSESRDDGGVRWGIDYLFGVVDTEERFTPIWAHRWEEERAALRAFLDFVAERRKMFPDLHIYHYAPYERTHLLSIAARHGEGEAEVDALLREHVLVDLYPIVRRSLLLGSRSYSIKKLEPLYMGDELRDDDGVTNGAQSVTEYAVASTLRASSDARSREEGERRLQAIADYNRYDCVSTLRLRDWLLERAAEHRVRPQRVSEEDAQQAGENGAPIELSAVASRLNDLAARAAEPHERTAISLASCAIDYHQREQKSFWWEHFARLENPIEDWSETRDVLIIDRSLTRVVEDWFVPPRGRTERRHLAVRGALAPGSRPRAGSEAYLLYDAPAPFPQRGARPGARAAHRVRILEVAGDTVTVAEMLPREAQPFADLPVALTPGPPPPAGAQKTAIEEWGAALAATLELGERPQDPVFDLLRRDPPRTAGGHVPVRADSAEALAAAGGAEEGRTIAALTLSLTRLDRSYIAVQGPPGTGKTFLASRVIRALAGVHGWRIGVVGQSHRVVENVLDSVVAAGLPSEQVGKVPQGGKLNPDLADGAGPTYRVLPENGHAAFLEECREAGIGCVIGGTAWDFSNEARVPRRSLDLLVIDEAGQFSLAPTVAAAVSAERLLMLGDPQQLPQVSQGTHPEPVDESALGWLLGEHETLPPEFGYFLAETRRMRPELASVVSELSYADRLRAHPTASLREVRGSALVSVPGLVQHPVSHSGNITFSPEEASEVVRIACEVLDGKLHELPNSDSAAAASEQARVRPLGPQDVIVVAAYNSQVECIRDTLRSAGLGDVRVGTVDRFQGQEAVVAIVSLAASDLESAPRGLEFLLMRNRLNVAISRAQWAAHLVASDRLGSVLPHSPEGVAALSAYHRLCERATDAGELRAE